MVTMQCRPTSRHLRPSGSISPDSGGARFDGAVKRTARRGHGSRSWLTTSFPNPASFILGQASALPSNTQGGSRMRESRTYGSVRGACSNGRPYRDPASDGHGQTGLARGTMEGYYTPDNGSKKLLILLTFLRKAEGPIPSATTGPLISG